MRIQRWLGLIFIALTVLFLAMDAGLKVVGAAAAISATGELGFSAVTTRVLGVVLAIVTVLYAIPRSSLLGAVLLTGYLGGAVAVQLQHGSPLASHVLFGVYVGLLAWASVWLRTPALRALVPFVKGA